jgi:hypothetical protein
VLAAAKSIRLQSSSVLGEVEWDAAACQFCRGSPTASTSGYVEALKLAEESSDEPGAIRITTLQLQYGVSTTA